MVATVCGGACEMSCVNERRFGPPHLLDRESGGSETGSQQPAGSFISCGQDSYGANDMQYKDSCMFIILCLY